MVIPTRDRPKALRRCLDSLDSQQAITEIVVVDDGSLMLAPVQAAVARSQRARLLRGSGSGPAAARNLGAAESSGEVVCFTDDDCVAMPGWAERLAAAVAGSGVAAGSTIAAAGAGVWVRATQLIIDHLQLDGIGPAGELRFAPSCNLAVSRIALERLRFDPRFPQAAGEDRAFSDEAIAAGAVPSYAPAAVIVHEQAPGLGAFVGRQLRYGAGAAIYRRGGAPASSGLRRRLLRRAGAEGPAVASAVALAQLITALGYLRQRLR